MVKKRLVKTKDKEEQKLQQEPSSQETVSTARKGRRKLVEDVQIIPAMIEEAEELIESLDSSQEDFI